MPGCDWVVAPPVFRALTEASEPEEAALSRPSVAPLLKSKLSWPARLPPVVWGAEVLPVGTPLPSSKLVAVLVPERWLARWLAVEGGARLPVTRFLAMRAVLEVTATFWMTLAVRTSAVELLLALLLDPEVRLRVKVALAPLVVIAVPVEVKAVIVRLYEPASEVSALLTLMVLEETVAVTADEMVDGMATE